MQHPHVAEAAVFGLPDAVYGERVVAVIVGSRDVRVEEVREWMAHHMPPYKVESKDQSRTVANILRMFFASNRQAAIATSQNICRPRTTKIYLTCVVRPTLCDYCAVIAQVPSVIHVLDSIPKNAMGKVRLQRASCIYYVECKYNVRVDVHMCCAITSRQTTSVRYRRGT